MPVLALALAGLAVTAGSASAADDPAAQPPFGGERPPPLVEPDSVEKPPPGFALSAREAIDIARTSEVVREELAETPDARPQALIRGDRWQVNYFDAERRKVAELIVDGTRGEIDEAWRDYQVETDLARGYDGAIAQTVNAPYVWLPLCLLFLAPFFDPRRPLRLVHLDLLVILGLSLSLLFFNRAEISASVALTYPVLGYLLLRMLVAGLWPRERPGPLLPWAPVRWLAVGVVVLVAARMALNVIDSQVIDIGVAGVIGADRIADGAALYEGHFADIAGLRGDVYGPVNYLAYLPFEQVFGWDGVWDDVPAAHAAAIGFDLLCVVGLVALGRRLRVGAEGRALGWALGFAWVSCPWTLYVMNANANDALVAMLSIGALLALRSPPARGGLIALAAAAKFGSAALAPLVRDRRRRAALARSADLLTRVRSGGGRGDAAFRPRRRPRRAVRPHARLPGDAQLPVQCLGPGARARLPPAGGPGTGGGAGAGGRAVSPLQEPGPDRRPGRRGDDRGSAHRVALVLLLRRLVPALRARGELRLAGADPGVRRSSSAGARAAVS